MGPWLLTLVKDYVAVRRMVMKRFNVALSFYNVVDFGH